MPYSFIISKMSLLQSTLLYYSSNYILQQKEVELFFNNHRLSGKFAKLLQKSQQLGNTNDQGKGGEENLWQKEGL